MPWNLLNNELLLLMNYYLMNNLKLNLAKSNSLHIWEAMTDDCDEIKTVLEELITSVV